MALVVSAGVRGVAVRGFAISEHCCALGYAVSEFYEAHHLLLYSSLALLLFVVLSLLCYGLDRCKLVEFGEKQLRYAEREI